MVEQKNCSKCGELRLRFEFYKNRKNKNGLTSWCKFCLQELDKKRDKFRKQGKEYKLGRRNYHLKKTYGITLNDFDDLFISQSKRCAICKSETPNGRQWNVDHDHKFPFKIRGILCTACNGMLGLAKDNTEVLQRAIQYLEVQYVAY